VALPLIHLFRLRHRSLPRAILLALGTFAASLRLAGFPDITRLHGSPWQFLCVLTACWALVEIARCLERKWSLYHAGVLLLMYTGLMILALALFLWLYP
jgi:hypothetical protein